MGAKEFKSFDAFTKHMQKVAKNFKSYETKAAMFLGQILEAEAKDKIGHLQDSAGPFREWAPLAAATLADKERQGYIFNSEGNPLYRTGELKDSIHHVYNPMTQTLYLGSDSEIMIYQEFGTKYIPPRSVIGLTMYQSLADVHYTMGNMLVSWLESKPLRKRKKTYGSV